MNKQLDEVELGPFKCWGERCRLYWSHATVSIRLELSSPADSVCIKYISAPGSGVGVGGGAGEGEGSCEFLPQIERGTDTSGPTLTVDR